MSCGVGCRHGSDLALLWLWLWPAATAAIRLLAWEPPYATPAAVVNNNNKRMKSCHVQPHGWSGRARWNKSGRERHKYCLIVACEIWKIQQTFLQNRYSQTLKIYGSKGDRVVGGWAGDSGWKYSKIGLWWSLYSYKCNKIHWVI